jgi:hypothetical protein
MKSVKELEAKILAGESVKPEDLVAARQREEAAAHIAGLQAQRQAGLDREARISNRTIFLNKKKEEFEQLQAGDQEALRDRWDAIIESVNQYVRAVDQRNNDLKVLSEALANEILNPTPGLVYPHRFQADNGGVTIDGKTVSAVDPITGVERAVAFAIGRVIPNYAPFLGYGGLAAAEAEGIQ